MFEKQRRLEYRTFYISFHSQLISRFGTRLCSRKQIWALLGNLLHIPKKIREVSIRELESMYFIEKVDSSNYKILPPKLDLERDANKLFRLWNIF